MSRVVSVNLGVVRTGDWTGRKGRTGIDKRAASGPVAFTAGGVVGDNVCDRDNHGAWHQAAYAFPIEELGFWSRELGKDLVPGNAGENLTLEGFDCNDSLVGERWRVGTAVLRVTTPRIPCRVFAGFWNVPRLVKRFTEHGRPGTYLAVEAPGEIKIGDTVEVLDQPGHGITVAQMFAFYAQGRKELAARIAGILESLPSNWAEKVQQAL